MRLRDLNQWTRADEQLARLREARAAMADTLAAWDARLERTPAGMPAHLLTIVPNVPRATRRGLRRR